MTHYIGNGSTYDDGMEVVEMMVKFHQGDKISAEALRAYYYSALLRHYERVQQFFKDPVDKLRKDTLKNFFNFYTPEKQIQVSEYIWSEISRIHKNFYDIEDPTHEILTLFIYIGFVLCGYTDPETRITKHMVRDFINFKKYIRLPKKLYPLPNDTGEFTYNTFLYAYVNGVLLVGTPPASSMADRILQCPYGFIEHDLGHYWNMYNFSDLDQSLIKNLYYIILNSSLDKKEKELLLTAFFHTLHEGYTFSKFFQKKSPYDDDVYQAYIDVTDFVGAGSVNTLSMYLNIDTYKDQLDTYIRDFTDSEYSEEFIGLLDQYETDNKYLRVLIWHFIIVAKKLLKS